MGSKLLKEIEIDIPKENFNLPPYIELKKNVPITLNLKEYTTPTGSKNYEISITGGISTSFVKSNSLVIDSCLKETEAVKKFDKIRLQFKRGKYIAQEDWNFFVKPTK